MARGVVGSFCLARGRMRPVWNWLTDVTHDQTYVCLGWVGGGFTTSTEGWYRIDTNASYLLQRLMSWIADNAVLIEWVSIYITRERIISMSINQSINRSIVSMLINQSIDDRSSTNQSIDQSINQSTNQSINETHLMNTCLKWRLDWVGLFYHACCRPPVSINPS